MIPIANLYNFILSMFGRRENQNGSQDICCTPPRAQSRAATTKDYKFSNVPDPDRTMEFEYSQRLPSRLPKSFPLIRNPSQSDLLGSTANEGGVENSAFDVRRKDSVIDLRAVPFNRRSSSTFDFHSASEESLYMPSNDIVDLEEHLTMRKTRPRNNYHSFTGAPRSMSRSNLRRFNSVPDNRRLPESCSPVTASSAISLSGSKKYTPLRTKGIARARGSSTNLRAQSRAAATKDYKFSNVPDPDRALELEYSQRLPSRLPKSFPRIRNPSQRDLLGSTANKGAQSRAGTTKDYKFSNVPDPDRAMELEYSQRLPSRLPKSFPIIRNPSLSDLLGSTANKGNLMLDNSFDFNILKSGNTRTRREDSSRDFRHVPAQKGSRSSVEFHSAAGTQLDGTQLNESSERGAFTMPMRQLQLRNNPHSTPGRLPCKRVHSKIPIPAGMRVEFRQKPAEFMNFPERRRGKYTLVSTKKYKYAMPGFQEKGDTTDTAHLKYDGINNFITFRNVIREKFEHVFKYLSMKKHHSIGNIIDANLHVYWMGVAGFSADKDAKMFRRFAGGKVVLTLAEYKVLLHKISTAYDLDYWDVLQKMATVQGEKFYDEEQIFFV